MTRGGGEFRIGIYFNIPEDITGSSVLSLDEVDLISSSEFFNEDQWVYTLVASGLGQTATGDFSAEEIEDTIIKYQEED